MNNKICNQLGVLRALLALCCFLTFHLHADAQSTQSTTGSPTKKITFEGRAMARDVVEVLPRSEGLVVEAVEITGGSVKPGDQLFRVDPQSYQFIVDRLQARFNNLSRQFKNINKELKKQKGLLEKKLTTANKVHTVLIAYNIVRGNLEETKAQLIAAEFELENTVVKSTIKGMLSVVNVDVGDMARRDGKPAVVIVNYDPIFIVVHVEPAMYLKIRRRQLKGMKRATNIILKFEDGVIYPHEGESVGSFHRVDAETGKVAYLLSFPNPDLLIIPGLKVEVTAEFEGFSE
jgi:membrane fusion protein (multidrug efflux system)